MIDSERDHDAGPHPMLVVSRPSSGGKRPKEGPDTPRAKQQTHAKHSG